MMHLCADGDVVSAENKVVGPLSDTLGEITSESGEKRCTYSCHLVKEQAWLSASSRNFSSPTVIHRSHCSPKSPMQAPGL